MKLTEDKKELRSRGRKTQERYNIMISIKNDLFRCCKNVITITKDEMQSLRRKLYEIKNENVPFTMKEHEVSTTFLTYRLISSNSIA